MLKLFLMMKLFLMFLSLQNVTVRWPAFVSLKLVRYRCLGFEPGRVVHLTDAAGDAGSGRG